MRVLVEDEDSIRLGFVSVTLERGVVVFLASIFYIGVSACSLICARAAEHVFRTSFAFPQIIAELASHALSRSRGRARYGAYLLFRSEFIVL